MSHHCFPCDRIFGDRNSLQQHLDSPIHNFECEECDKSFCSQHALQQHLDSPAHIFECEECDKSFGSQHSLQQHLDSPAHVFACDDCEKSFGSQNALQQHLDSPAHVFGCDDCGKSFGSQRALQQHLDSPVHVFKCDDCDKSFGSQRALQQHLDSPIHNIECEECDKSFGSEHALQQHLNSPAHIPETHLSYIGIPSSVVNPIYQAAYQLRFRKPTVDDILRQTKTKLDITIVSSLLSAALRNLPPDNTPQGVALRIEQDRIKRAESQQAEDAFCMELSHLGYVYLREHQQGPGVVTPDVRFQTPVPICGHLCWWIEYKTYFGFRSNPFIAKKNKRQYKKYATQIGPGAVVYKLGFEIGHVDIDGVMTFREKEVLHDLKTRILRT